MRKILTLLLTALLSFPALLHSQSLPSIESLRQTALSINHNNFRDVDTFLKVKAEVESGAAWTNDVKQSYMLTIQTLTEYYGRTQQYDQQEMLLSDAMHTFNQRDSIANTPYTRLLWCMKVRTLIEIGNYDGALHYALQARTMYNAVNDYSADYCMLCYNLSLIYLSRNELLRAKLYSDEALETMEEIIAQYNLSKYWGYYHFLNLHGVILLKQQRAKEASRCFEQLVEEVSPDSLASIYNYAVNNLAEAYLSEHQYDKAIALLESIKSVSPDLRLNILQELLFLYIHRNQTDKALDCLHAYNVLAYRDVESVVTRFSEVEREEYLKNRGWLLAMINNGAAQAVPGSTKEAFDANLFACHASLAANRTLRNNRHVTLHLDSLKQAISAPDLSSWAQDSLRRLIIDGEKETLRNDSTFLSKMNARIGSYVQTRDSLQRDEAYVMFCSHVRVDIKDYSSQRRYAAYIVRPHQERPCFIDLGEADSIDDLYSKALLTPEVISNVYAAPNAQKLYNLLWKPLLPQLKGARRIYFTTTGELSKLNFNALMDGKKRRLRQTTALVRVSSPLNISLTREAFRCESLTAFGNPAFNLSCAQMPTHAPTDSLLSPSTDITSMLNQRGESLRGSWQPIPGTAKEVENISQLFAQQSGLTLQCFTDTAATEEAFKRMSGHSPQVVHIATHGFTINTMQQYVSSPFLLNRLSITPNSTSLLWSGLALAGANLVWQGKRVPPGTEDGILTADEIARLDLSGTRLVVLSACETGLGRIDALDGIWGLQRAFKQAGAGSLLMTLWKVSDDVTLTFMTEFYRLLSTGLSPRECLLRSQEYLITHGASNPYYWAPFILID